MFCGYLALGATLQELPPFLAAKFHAGPAMTGLVVGAAFAATAAGRPFAGRWGDAGRSRAVVVAGGLLAAAAGAGTALAPDIAVLLLCRLVMGAGEAALFSGALPWVLAGTPPDQRGRVAGWFGLSMWGGLTLGPVLAAGVAGAADSEAVWWTVAGLPLLAVALVGTAGAEGTAARAAAVRVSGAGAARTHVSATKAAAAHASTAKTAATHVSAAAHVSTAAHVSATKAAASAEASASKPATAYVSAPVAAAKPTAKLIPPGVSLPGAIIGLAAYGYGTLAAILVLSLGHSAGRVVALPVFACAFLVVRGFGSPLVDRRGGAAVSRSTLIVQAAGLGLLAAAPNPGVTLAGAALTGAGLGLIYPATAAMTLHRSRAETAGAAVGAMTSFWDLGILIAGPVSGAIAAGVSYHAAFAAAVVATLLALLLAVRASSAPRSTAH